MTTMSCELSWFHWNELKIEVDGKEWIVAFPQYNSSVVLSLEGSIDKELISIVKEHQQVSQKLKTQCYRRQYQLKTHAFLFCFHFKENYLALFSPRLERELTAIHLLEDRDLHDKKEIVDSLVYREWRKRVEWALTIDPSLFPLEYERISVTGNYVQWMEGEKGKTIIEGTEHRLRKLQLLIENYRPPFLEKVNDWVLSQLARFDILRQSILSFLSLLPQLHFKKSAEEVKKLLIDALCKVIQNHREAKKFHREGVKGPLTPWWIGGVRTVYYLSIIIPARFWEWSIRQGVEVFAKRFIVGETIEKAKNSLLLLHKSERTATLDLLGELVTTDSEAEEYALGVLRLLNNYAGMFENQQMSRANLPCVGLSVKVSALCSFFSPDEEERCFDQIAPRLKKILMRGRDLGAFITIDAEHYPYRDMVFRIYRRVLLENSELSDYRYTGIVLQGYLRDSHIHLEEILSLAKERSLPMPIRLVKGAYWDSETHLAQSKNYDPMQFLNKEETDLHFRMLVYKILSVGDHLQLCLASHNFTEHCLAESMREESFPSSPIIEHQCLHMTCEALSLSLSQMGWAVRDYVPIGDLFLGMGYLVRRIMENASQVGFLTAMRSQRGVSQFELAESLLEKKKKSQTIIRYESEEVVSSHFFTLPPLETYKDVLTCKVESGSSVLYPKEDLSAVIKKLVLASEIDGELRSLRLLMTSTQMSVQSLELMRLNSSYRPLSSTYGAMQEIRQLIDLIRYYSKQSCQLDSRLHQGILLIIVYPEINPAQLVGVLSTALLEGWRVIWCQIEGKQIPLMQKIFQIFQETGWEQFLIQQIISESEIESYLNSKEITLLISIGNDNELSRLRELNSHPHIPFRELLALNDDQKAYVILQNGEVTKALLSFYHNFTSSRFGVSLLLVQEGVGTSFRQKVKMMLESLPPHFVFASEQEKQIFLQKSEKYKDEAFDLGGQILVDRAYDGVGSQSGPLVIELPFEKALKESDFLRLPLKGPLLYFVVFKEMSEAIQLLQTLSYPYLSFWSESVSDRKQFIDQVRGQRFFINKGIEWKVGQYGEATSFGSEVGTLSLLTDLCYHRPSLTLYGCPQKEEGSDQPNHFYRSANYRPVELVENMIEGIDKLYRFYPAIKGGYAESERTILNQIKEFILSKGDLLLLDRGNIREKGFYMANHVHPSSETLLYFLVAMMLGCKMVVWASNRCSYQFWLRIQSFFVKEGAPLFQLFFPTKSYREKLFTYRPVDFCIAEGDWDELKLLQQQLLQKYDQNERERILLTREKAPHLHSIQEYIDSLIIIKKIIKDYTNRN